MSPRTLFIAGAHTEIGKTHAACCLIRAAREAGWATNAVKPVVSGFDEGDWAESDPGRLLAALGEPLTIEALERLSPFRFKAPLAPPAAAAREGRPLPLEQMIAFCRRRIAESDARLVVVEGVGGLMSPIADGGTSLDLLEAVGGPSVLVGGGYLGAMSHTLTALEVLRTRGIAPSAVVLSQAAEPDAPDFQETIDLLKAYAGPTPVLAAPRTGEPGWAVEALRLAFG
jgi:dethiobiotin synthetase